MAKGASNQAQIAPTTREQQLNVQILLEIVDHSSAEM